MKKLTKKQRHEIYKNAYIISADGTCGCKALFSQLYECNEVLYLHYKKMEFMFPEYNLFRPENMGTLFRWFSELNDKTEIAQRQTAFLFCIEMTK